MRNSDQIWSTNEVLILGIAMMIMVFWLSFVTYQDGIEVGYERGIETACEYMVSEIIPESDSIVLHDVEDDNLRYCYVVHNDGSMTKLETYVSERMEQ